MLLVYSIVTEALVDLLFYYTWLTMDPGRLLQDVVKTESRGILVDRFLQQTAGLHRIK